MIFNVHLQDTAMDNLWSINVYSPLVIGIVRVTSRPLRWSYLSSVSHNVISIHWKTRRETANASYSHRLEGVLGPSLQYSFHFSPSDLIYLGLDSAVRHRLVSQTILGCTSNCFHLEGCSVPLSEGKHPFKPCGPTCKRGGKTAHQNSPRLPTSC